SEGRLSYRVCGARHEHQRRRHHACQALHAPTLSEGLSPPQYTRRGNSPAGGICNAFIPNPGFRGPLATPNAHRSWPHKLRPMSFYVTTPIYYVNDRPHIGHCYTSLLADAMARFQRLHRSNSDRVFFLTGTDEHADKVVTAAAANKMTPQEWSDRNAAEYKAAYEFLG